MRELKTDVLIVGGGTGGCAAAMAAASLGCSVIMCEPTAWIGGQLTSQAVPPDEHPWIEMHGCTGRYREFRQRVRQFYRDNYPLAAAARFDARLNPGQGGVSRLCHEPRVALAVLEAMLAWPQSADRLLILRRHEPVAAAVAGDRVRSVTLRDLDGGGEVTISASYVLDASELGDLLPLAGVEYVSGAESQSQTGEMHAPTGPARPDNVQAITWCFPLAHDPAPNANHVIDPPEGWRRWREYVPQVTPAWPVPMLSWLDPAPWDVGLLRHNYLFPEENPPVAQGATRGGSRWHYRRIVHAGHYDPAGRPHEVTLVNWPHNDYIEGGLIDVSPQEHERTMRESKQLSLALLYWLQTEAPNYTTGGRGYPRLYLRPDMTGTPDGLALFPYIRESRRIRAVFTVTETHVGTEARLGRTYLPGRDPWASLEGRAEPMPDSVGVGCYRIDLHISTGGDNYVDISSLPFQIPLGALLPVRMRNLLPACKNLGVTHLTNGCYRLHPVEWNIGESAGLLAAFCHQRKTEPHAVREKPELLAEFQQLLTRQAIELAWPQTHAV